MNNEKVTMSLANGFYGVGDYLSMSYLNDNIKFFDSSCYKKIELLITHMGKNFEIFDLIRDHFSPSNSKFIQTRSQEMVQISNLNDYVIEYELSLGRKYTTIVVHFYTNSHDLRDKMESEVRTMFSKYEITDCQNFLLNWYFHNGRHLDYVEVKELFNDDLLDSAYPMFEDGIAKFVDDFLESDESVLILMGPAGTGKSKLVRYILATMTEKYGYTATLMYTGDTRAVEQEKLFIDFCSSDVDGIVIEDADYLLEPRSDGNEIMDNFLRAADGVVRAQQRKMIFTTNIASKNDISTKIDEALIRPGRCFDVKLLGKLTPEESEIFLRELTGEEDVSKYIDVARIDGKGYTLAELYKSVKVVKSK